MSGTSTSHARLQDAETVAKVLAKARDAVTDVAGAVVATRDGLVMAANIDPELEAAARAAVPKDRRSRFETDDMASKTSAMASVAAGLGAQFVQAAGSGQLQAVTFEGSTGCVGVFPLTSTLLLVLFGDTRVTMGRFVVASKQALTVILGPHVD
jgi:predicted regulator of Ras-like GTPase activity (Roadblock/LC7/MglB family)